MYSSWGNYFRYRPKTILSPQWQDDLDLSHDKPMLAYGKGRSYGDSCLLDNGVAILTHRLKRFIKFDRKAGIVRCEAGISLADILNVIVPAGWMLPVVPGTQNVTLGGAISNDIHGKNHTSAGTFGCHVLQFELLRSNGERIICSAHQNLELYSATIGGLGLTGFITWAELQLKPITSPFLECETIRFNSLADFFTLNAQQGYEYRVAWLDCHANDTGRGIFIRGNHTSQNDRFRPKKECTIPFYLPNFILNRLSIKLYNKFYYAKAKTGKGLTHYSEFFFPLDTINHWNRIYGKRGFFQYQCVIPEHHSVEGSEQLLNTITTSGQYPFLSVIKTFGDIISPGILSFPFKGVTLALDFPNRGPATLALFEKMDDSVLQWGGRIYPAKDARMSAITFQQSYPQWQTFKQYIDPQFSSNFWQRVMLSIE